MQSLRDKLLKAGLVSPEAAQRADAEGGERPGAAAPRAGAKPRDPHGAGAAGPRSGSPQNPRRAAARAPGRSPPGAPGARGSSAPSPRPSRPGQHRTERPVPKLPPLPGTAAAHRLASREQLLLDRKLRELVLAAQVPPEPGATTFYFVTRKNKLRRLELSAEQAKLLEDGQLAIVERPDPDKIEHALVPPAVARELRALSARAVRFLKSADTRIGFLSDDEISQRAHEADSDDASDEHDAPGADGAAPGEEPSGAAASGAPEAAPSPEPETFIRVRRAPR